MPPRYPSANCPTCKCKPGARCYFIEIVNSNAARDDNFDIVLNGHALGALDLSADSTCNGGWWSNCQVSPGDLCRIPVRCCFGNCDPDANDCSPTLTSYARLDDAFFLTGANVLEMNNTQNNQNANFGNVYVWRLKRTSGFFQYDTTLLASFYAGGGGDNFTFGFTI